MNPIKDALHQGYSEEEIINFISNAYPHLTKKIGKALQSGYGPQQILNFITPMFSQQKEKPVRGGSQSVVHAQKRQQDIEANKRLMKQGLKIAGSVAAAPLLGQAVKGLAPLLSKRGVPRIGVAGTEPLEISVQPKPIPSTPEVTYPENTPEINALLNKLGLGSKIQRLAERNQPEAIPGALGKLISPEVKQSIEESSKKPIEEAIKSYAKNYLTEKEKTDLSLSSLKKQADEFETPEEKPAKNVILPDGKVGTLTDERQGIGTIELPNGQIKRQKIADIHPQSEEAEEYLTALKESIPEEKRSSVLGFVSYNVPNKMLALQFKNGDFYVYPGADEEDFKKIISNTTLAKTSGENWRGIYTEGESSRGAGAYQVLKKLEEKYGKNNFIKFSVKDGYEYPLNTILREIEKRIEKKRKKGLS